MDKDALCDGEVHIRIDAYNAIKTGSKTVYKSWTNADPVFVKPATAGRYWNEMAKGNVILNDRIKQAPLSLEQAYTVASGLWKISFRKEERTVYKSVGAPHFP